MADAITFSGVEEHHLIGFGDRLVTPEMPDEYTLIGEDQMRFARVLFGAPMGMTSLTSHFANRDGVSLEKRLRNNLRFPLRHLIPPRHNADARREPPARL